MNDLNIIIEGTSKIHNIDIPNIYGGFGADKKAITDKTIAELHNIDNGPREIRKRINNNLKQFEEGIDYIDLKRGNQITALLDLGYAKQSITQAKNIYLLSERGYLKLIKIMDTQLAWDIYNEMLEEYFNMRETFEYEQSAEMRDRIQNGFNYKEIASYIDDGYTVREFEILDLNQWTPLNKYPKTIVRNILKTTDNDITKILNEIKDRENISYNTKKDMKQFFDNNNISYLDVKGGYQIGEHKLTKCAILSEEDVINVVLKITTDKGKEIREHLIRQGYMRIQPIKCITVEEEAQKYYDMYIEQIKLNQELKEINETLKETNNALEKDRDAFKQMTDIANNKIQIVKQESYDEGYEAGYEKAKKEIKKENSIINRLKKWAKNKFGGDEQSEPEQPKKQECEIKEYDSVKDVRQGTVTDLGKPIAIPKKKTIIDLRKELNGLVNKVINEQNLNNEAKRFIWHDIHSQISKTFRNGQKLKYVYQGGRSSYLNDYKYEEFEYAIKYVKEKYFATNK